MVPSAPAERLWLVSRNATAKPLEENKQAEVPKQTPPPAKKVEHARVDKKRSQEQQAEKEVSKVAKGDDVNIDSNEKKQKVAPKADAAETKKQRTPLKPGPKSILKTQPAGSAASKPNVRFEWHYDDFDEDVNSDIDAPDGLDHI